MFPGTVVVRERFSLVDFVRHQGYYFILKLSGTSKIPQIKWKTKLFGQNGLYLFQMHKNQKLL